MFMAAAEASTPHSADKQAPETANGHRCSGPRLYKPERPLPPHEAECASERPCSCAICREVPAAPATKEVPSSTNYVGIYPRGLKDLAVSELSRAGCQVMDHQEKHCMLIFQIPVHEESKFHNVEKAVLTLSAFEIIFEMCCAPAELPPSPTVGDVQVVAEAQMRATAGIWRRHLRCHSCWRSTMHRNGKTLSFKTPAIAPVIGDGLAAIGAISLSPECTAGPRVDLENFDVEVVAYISDGIDELQVVTGAARRKALAGLTPELLVLGIRSLSACLSEDSERQCAVES